MSRRTRPLVLVAAAVLAGVLAPAAPAEAHPISNFSVNQYAGLTLHPDRVDVLALADIAEIPTLQEKPKADTDGNGTLSDAETAAYGSTECRRFADALAVSVGRDRLTWTITAPSYRTTPGAGGLATSRLSCSLTAPADLGSTATVHVDNRYESGRVGWRELTATGDGVRIDTSLPAESISARLTSYPKDLLTSTPDMRTATIEVGGTIARTGAAPIAPTSAGPSWLTAAQSRVESVVGGHLTPVVIALAFLLALLLGAGHAALPGHGKTVMAAYFAGRRGRMRDALAVGGTVTLAHTGGVLAVGLLLSTSTALAGEQVLTWLGAASGVLVVAVGVGMLVSARRARRPLTPRNPTNPPTDHHGHIPGAHTRDLTHSHTKADSHTPELVAAHSHTPDAHTRDDQLPLSHADGERHTHVHEGGAAHNHGDGTTHDHSHSDRTTHDHDRGEAHGHDHGLDGHGHSHGGWFGLGRGHSHGHGHGHGHGHSDGHDGADNRRSRPGGRLGLAGIGLAGGLVPSPSALVVLLGAIGLGRAGLGVLLVLAYGIGMAGTLTAVGLLLVVAQRKLGTLIARGGRTARLGGLLTRATSRVSAGAPTATAALVVLVGLGMGFRAVG